MNPVRTVSYTHLDVYKRQPYVVSAHAAEFAADGVDRRFRRYMQEAAENACRIFTHDPAAHSGVSQLVGDLEGRVVAPAPVVDDLPRIYRDALNERFGRLPPNCDL